MEHVRQLIEAVATRLEGLAKTKTVIGDPLEVQGRTLIPLIEVSLGVGGGGFAGEGEGGGQDEKGREGKGKGQAKGGGTGGGMKVTPIAVICLEPSGVSGFALGGKKGSLDRLADLMPQVMEKWREMKGKGGEKSGAADTP